MSNLFKRLQSLIQPATNKICTVISEQNNQTLVQDRTGKQFLISQTGLQPDSLVLIENGKYVRSLAGLENGGVHWV